MNKTYVLGCLGGLVLLVVIIVGWAIGIYTGMVTAQETARKPEKSIAAKIVLLIRIRQWFFLIMATPTSKSRAVLAGTSPTDWAP